MRIRLFSENTFCIRPDSIIHTYIYKYSAKLFCNKINTVVSMYYSR